MPRHKKGTLVRVLREKLMGDEYEVDKHGSLWLVEGFDSPSTSYYCKSLATGYVYMWYPNEITTRKEKEHEAHR